MSELSVLDSSGDTKLIWDRGNEVEVEAARELFAKLKHRQYLAYRVTGLSGDKGEVLHKFDPDAERIIMAPPMVGG